MARTVLITGASSGFGAALVTAFADAGWHVAATMRNPAKMPASLHALPNVRTQCLDVTDETSIRDAVAAVESCFGPVDVLLNVAGNVVQGTLEELSIDQVRAQLETNVVGVAAVTKALLPGMRQRRSGHIINFSSGGGLVGVPRLDAYVASKFAVEGLSEALSRDVSHLGLQVTIVEPGVFHTDLGDSAVQPAHPIEAYAPAADQLPGLYDWTPGNLEGAARAIASIAARPGAPLRLYVGHGLDDVRRHYHERLDGWAASEHLTRGTL
ncbi:MULTISPECIES: SDR family oxidoreductase [unclassified Rhodococcus (in: high G+C Gram-positive bacteria)]|uniref:SDR family oxidoreductase n=1 Tax=unclassified Rhodococcus (in: high G+C Gram-positive bacteria) TaxID=192944 RepID=UPI00163A8F8E|nr:MULTISPECIES: SDR family oxidoreductase [unclassified Rhodococcus (in: high G+C Gram-positive bacteria)]MBC2644203.1 SDR family oxidoreductase [Rhodococcus sp. 3A]MBC2891058.1 SDR family oxidoreductase [Rhodococcus sp. 4CII]